MRFGITAALVMLSGCAGLDVPAIEGYEAIRAALDIKTDPATGTITASAAPAAKEEVYRPTYISGMDDSGTFTGVLPSERARSKFYVEGHKAADGTVQIYFVSAGQTPVMETAIQEKPWTETNPDSHGYVGDPWRKVYWELVEYRHECDGPKLTCVRFKTDRMRLSEEDVRALLAEGRDEIRVSRGEYRQVSSRLDVDQLAAVLDALGARERFK